MSPMAPLVAASPRAELAARYVDVRRRSESLCDPLEAEDYATQSMNDVSPPKWHQAHVTWFFETFLLEPFEPVFEPFHPAFRVVFNSYYDTVGEQHPRHRRGLLSRPTIEQVQAYRRAVDDRMAALIESVADDDWAAVSERVELGIHHEQQHQELLLMDIKHNLYCNPLGPAYRERPAEDSGQAPPQGWAGFEGGVIEIGHGGDGFCYDNETPRHRVYVDDFELADRCVTAGEYLSFIEDGGYDEHSLWLADGWTAMKERGWRAPLYWEQRDDDWHVFTLHGWRRVDRSQPVVHTSYYEADAFARWSGARLPTEAEWEHAASAAAVEGNFVESGALHPRTHRPDSDGLGQLFGDVWELTASPYVAYPGYRPLPGALGEYNGKFMVNQMVLRGGSCATPRSHIRPTYRNFFYPHQRWMFSGLRLAREP